MALWQIIENAGDFACLSPLHLFGDEVESLWIHHFFNLAKSNLPII